MAALLNHPASREQAKVMNRYDITRRLIGLLHQDEAVIGGIGYTNFDLWAASDGASGRRPQNFYMLGSMGLAVPIAMGVAIAQPARKVFALEGDGSILMQLGSLATVAGRAQKNLCIIIMDNGAYQITGGQKTMTAQGADIVGIAKASGLAQSAWAADEDAFVELVGRSLHEDGPWLIGCRIDTQKPVDTTERDPLSHTGQLHAGLGLRDNYNPDAARACRISCKRHLLQVVGATRIIGQTFNEKAPTMTSLRGNNGPRYRHAVDDAAPYESITIDKLTPIIGAEIGGVDLSGPLPNHQMAEIHRALAENNVIFFRDQHLTPEQHLGFGRNFGGLHIHPAAPHAPEHRELMIIRADKDSPRANGEGWHSDVSCDSEPPMGSILYIKECPPRGGDTLFASMYAAYEALSDRMKAYLQGLTAIHDGEESYRGTYKNLGVEDKPVYPRAEHPVIRTHPVTGRKALYVNRGFTKRILNVPRDESAAILSYLYDHAENPLFQCRFRWSENAVAFWDNRCVQHRAMWDYWPNTRSGFRVTVAGDKPV